MNVTVIAGGVGGAKLVKGLSKILAPGELSVIVNTGDDFEHYGLHISPDIDSIVYALADLVDPVHGYGRTNDSHNCFDTLEEYGDNPWFKLGDKDLAMHLKRTSLLRSGNSLSETTIEICKNLGISTHVIPMTNDHVSTIIESNGRGELSFQEYFVKYRFEPEILSITYTNSQSASLPETAALAINNADVIVISPSNPWLSIFPVLSIPNTGNLILRKPVIAVSPIIGGKAVKGPAAKIFLEFGKKPSATGVAELYRDWLDGIIIDSGDKNEEQLIENLGIKVAVADIMMKDIDDKIRIAKEVLDFAELVT